ncbi:penicillin-binding protein [Sporolactobacillus spathodeae]|uniref:Penicillin-binding protein 2B n=1 Tax=Sporolactobacillus spathodeae TaxID=1465502 RepID=A0ABS2Q944_9BACL|nr:penicillin-binding protein [Sporolactobacillus spathodeae]MBM7658294.1 penicillin-binding protein 2B [Sporolactobacillus spathodeae]
MLLQKKNSISKMTGFVGIIIMLTFFVIIGRFVYIAQMKEIKGHQLIPLGEKQWSEVKLIDEKRGTIYSSNGQILAEDVPAYTLYAVISSKATNRVKNKEKTAAELAPILGMSQSDILNQLNKHVYQVEFGSKGRMLSYSIKKKIDRLHLPGIYYMTESRRYYPEQSSAAYAIGFTQTNPNNNEQKGVFGIEQYLNRYLTEKDGSVRYYRSLGGVPIPDQQQHLTRAYPGENVYLTLNTRIQTVLDQSMAQVNQEYKPTSMVGIVCDPKTGAILGMSTYPNFNPNKRDIKQFSDLAIADPYEPGSVMKTFTIASAIDAGVFNGKATYPSGSYQTDGGTIHDWNRSGWGSIDFDQGFELSSNVGMSILVNDYLKTERFYSYLKKFGFMSQTGIDLPGEGYSHVNWQYKIDQLEASFGQGSAFTAMQIVKAATAIANNGKMMRPYLIDKVVNPVTGKVTLRNRSKTVGYPVSAAAAKQTRALMRKVVSNHHVVGNYGATGVAYDLPGYDVIGKTGTAQIGSKNGYLVGKNNYVYSFLGMAPEKDPKLIVYVAVKQPHLKPTDLGEEPVEAIVRPVMTSSLQYLQVKKKIAGSSNLVRPTDHKLTNMTGMPMDEAAQRLKDKGFDAVTVGDGTVRSQMPYSGEQLVEGSKVILYSSDNPKMPDISGWSLADVMKLAEAAGLKLTEQGDGYVLSQNPAAGTLLKKGDSLSVHFRADAVPDQQSITTNTNSGTSDVSSSSVQP